MKVYEISMLVFLCKDIDYRDSLEKIGEFIDSGLAKKKEFLDFHNKNIYKNYCFCSFYPLEKDKIYKRRTNYTIRIRTVESKLAQFFNEELVNCFNQNMKGLIANMKILPKQNIKKIYSITPLVIKTDNGYWKNRMSLSFFERRLKENLIKKYNFLLDTKIDEDFQLYTGIEFKNKTPIVINYKGNKILGDKVSITVANNKRAQELAYMSLGTGVSEMNPRGAGFVNFKQV